MKWYYFGLLSLVACTFSGLLGWYVGGMEGKSLGGIENKFLASAAVVIVCVASGVIYLSRDFRRKFPAYSLLDYSCVVIYGAAALINHHRHLPQ